MKTTKLMTQNQLSGGGHRTEHDAGFIEHPELQDKCAVLPFQKVWIKPGFEKSGYRELIVVLINTDHMEKMDWIHRQSSANILGSVKRDGNRSC